MHACMIPYLMLYLWQDLYEESQARVGALERQLAALQVADDDEEEGAEGDAEDGAEVDDEDAAGEEGAGDDDGDGEEWQLTPSL